MDNYFKAAVCDLDKLLDEFEQNADEYDCGRTSQNQHDLKHHSLSSVVDCLQHVHPTPKLQEDASDATSSEEVSLASHIGTSEALLSYSPQNEKSVAGPDLLSTVDSGSLNDTQASNLGWCSVPVCDLVNDTGNVIHSVATHEDTQNLQPDGFQDSEGLIDFGISCIPVPTCVSSAGCTGVSSTEQSDGDSVLQDSGHLKTEEVNHLSLRSGSGAPAKILDLCDDQHKTESLQCSEIFDQLEQTSRLNAACVTVTSPNLNVCSPKDEKAYEKLPCEPQDESGCSAVSKEVYGINEMEKVDSKNESNVESIPSDQPKRPQLHKSHEPLPGSCVSPGPLCQTANIELENKITEDNVGSEEINSNEILNSVSTACISVEDVETSLSCFPLPVSICGSVVVTEEKVNPLPQNEMAEVISDILTVHAAKSKTDHSGSESCENTDLHEQEGCLSEMNESIVEESTDGGKCDTENVIDDSDSQQIEGFASAFLDYEAEAYGVGIDPYYTESMSPVMDDFSIEENIIKSDTLISDAELDDFLYGQSLQSTVVKSSDNDSNVIEADADVGNSAKVNNVDFTEVTEEHLQAKLEEINSINSNPKISLTASESVSVTKETVSRVQDLTEGGSEALVSDVCTKGARPKQLSCLSQRPVAQRQLNRTDTLERESQEASSLAPETLGMSVSVGKNPEPACSGESRSEAGGNQTPENTESPKTSAALSWKQPLWVPDSEAPNCMNCQVKFTFTKRRHHCRACGKVFCGGCCKRKCKLQYMEKEARVCTGCYDDINKAQAFERMMSPTGPVPHSSISSENSSAVPSLEEAQISGSASSPSPSALLPISVLKQPGIEGLCPKEQRRVWFADGILPNGEVADTTKFSSGARRSSQDFSPVIPDLPEMPMAAYAEEDDILTDVNPKPKEEAGIITSMEELHPVCSEDAQQGIPDQSEVVHSHKSVTEETKECSPTAEAEKTRTSSVDDTPVSPSAYRALCGVENCVRKKISLVPDGDKLPPLLLAVGEKGKGPLVEEHPSHEQVTLLLVEGGLNPLTFILNANLLVNVRLITYSSEKCWFFSTNGLHGVGQAEIVILLQCLPDEDIFPCEILKVFIDIYKDAMKGKFIRNMENITFTESFLSNKEHGGFLFVSPPFQKLDDHILPDNPFLCGILIHKLEIPWAKVFPIRLMLRLGAEYGTYPTPVVSFRHRKPLFGEIGHTIMNLLVSLETIRAEMNEMEVFGHSFLFAAVDVHVIVSWTDLRNYQYTLHTIENLFVHVEMGRSCIKIPLRKHNEVMKVVNSSNEHVISIGASFNTKADSHLVCVQNKHGIYDTQAISATGHPRKVTGVSFVVFNGALKPSSGFLAKSSIVEDGLMVQITPETMESLRQALRDKKDFEITCGKTDTGDIKEYVNICWVENEEKTNKGILSPVDGKSMEGTLSEKVPQGREFEREGKVIKCTEVYCFLKDHELSCTIPHQFAKEIAAACSSTLRPHLKTLKKNGMNKIGLRVSVDSDMVEYLAGSGGHLLPQNYLNELDSALIPVILGGMSDPTSLPLKMELIFFITEHLF